MHENKQTTRKKVHSGRKRQRAALVERLADLDPRNCTRRDDTSLLMELGHDQMHKRIFGVFPW